MKRIWFRVGMEAEISEEELEILKSEECTKREKLMCEIIERAELLGETYLPLHWGDDRYDNPEDKEIVFDF